MAKRAAPAAFLGLRPVKTGLGMLLAAAWLWPVATHAEEHVGGKEKVETEHIFGFTEGTDIGEKGEQEFESTTVGRFGRAGRYTGIANESAYRNVLTDGFRLSFAAFGDYHGIREMPGLADRTGASLSGAASELRWQFSDRTKLPIGFSVSLMPEFRWIDDIAGTRTENYALPVVVALDAAPVPDKFFTAFNFIYDPGIARDGGGWERSLQIEASGAVSYAITPEVFVGAELRYIAWDEQATLSRGLFAGPSLYVKLSKTSAIKVAWSTEIAEDTAHGPALASFERNQAIVLFVKSF